MKAKITIHRSLARFLMAAVLVIQGSATFAASASPSELLEKGIYSEETKGDLDAAIALYQQVVTEVKTSESLAAQAQFRLAQCYVKKSKSVEAKAAFEKLIHDFPNEKDLVAKARQHLPGDLTLGPVPWVDGERLQMAIKLPGGLEIGGMETRADQVESGGKKIWRVGRIMGAGGVSISTVDVEPDTFRPLTSYWKHTLIGEASAIFHSTEAEVKAPGAKEAKKVPLEKPVYDNEECFHLLRRLPLKVGYKGTVPIITTLGGGGLIDMEVAVDKKETIQVPAGKFDCLVLTIKFPAHTFWFSDDEHHYMVKFEGGGAVGELASIAQRKPNEPYAYHNAVTGVSFMAPAGWMVHFQAKGNPSDADGYAFTDAKGDAEMAILSVHTTDSLKDEAKKSSRAWAEEQIKSLEKMLKDAKVRADGWKDETVAGLPGVSVTLDYAEGDKPRVARGFFAVGPKVSTKFTIAAAPEKFEGLLKAFEGIIASYKNSQ